MNGKAIIYPYWENLARGYEDIIALLTVVMLLLLLYPVVTVIWCFVHWWRHKGWTLKEVWHTGKDKAERAVAGESADNEHADRGNADTGGDKRGTAVVKQQTQTRKGEGE